MILAFLSHSAVAQSGEGKPFHENHNAYYQVVSFCDGSPAQSKPDFANVLFGKGEELLMAHLITAPPDFDQVLSVNMPGHGQVITDEDLSRGVLVTFSERANSPSARLKEGEQASAEIHTSVDGNPAALQVQGATEWYFEEGELNGFLPRPG